MMYFYVYYYYCYYYYYYYYYKVHQLLEQMISEGVEISHYCWRITTAPLGRAHHWEGMRDILDCIRSAGTLHSHLTLTLTLTFSHLTLPLPLFHSPLLYSTLLHLYIFKYSFFHTYSPFLPAYVYLLLLTFFAYVTYITNSNRGYC